MFDLNDLVPNHYKIELDKWSIAKPVRTDP
jgi:hypothetical protein